jgi:ubiquinone/menaquinone biosynthesis C-methylase UbiE
MKTTTEFWRYWWNEFGKRSSADFEVDRGTTLRIDELEQRAVRQFLEAIDPKPTDLVLDAGCGTGVNFSRLSGRVADIVGIDLSEEMLGRAERRIAAEKIKNVRLLLGNVAHIEFPSGTFDKVVCTSVLQYLNDDECEAALKEMIRVCKYRAIMVIHLKNRTSLYGLTRMMVQFIARLIRRRTTPDYYRPRAWYELTISRLGGSIVDYDSFGIFTLVKMPQSILRRLLQLEMKLQERSWLKKFGVNYKMTIRIERKDVGEIE